MSKKFFSMLAGGTLTMMVVSVMLMSDSIIAGSVIGSDAVAGVTLVTPLYSLAAFFGSVISLGVPILYTTEMGKFNKERADQVFGLGVLMSIIMGVVLFVLTCLFGEMYLHSSSPSEAILNEARGYLFWMRFTILIIPFQSLIAATVYSNGDETVSTIANGVQGLGNISFSIILSHFLGIRGIGLASFTFYVVSVLILLIHFRRKSNTLRWNLYFSPDVLGEVIRYSIIDSSCYLFFAILTAVLNTFIGARYGPEYLILASVITLSREFQLLFDGIGQASAPIFSVYLGEENRSGLRSSYALANRVAIAEGVIVTLILVIIAPFVPQVLNITRPELFGHAVAGIRMAALGATFISLLYTNAGHNYPYLQRKGQPSCIIEKNHGLFLGGLEFTQYKQDEIHLDPGDRILLYTDGVVEAHDKSGGLYGNDRLEKMLDSSRNLTGEQVLQQILNDVNVFAAGVPQFDDITMIVLSIKNQEENT